MKQFVLIFQYGKLLREGDVVVLQFRDSQRETKQYDQEDPNISAIPPAADTLSELSAIQSTSAVYDTIISSVAAASQLTEYSTRIAHGGRCSTRITSTALKRQNQ
jgi:hypothetical protein